jgi:tripartite-type tricarboxylate transporter receptor subunit TctC
MEVAVSRSLFAGLICLGLVASAAQAQSNYPNRTVKIIVPSTPGGGSDTFARLVAQHLSEAFGQQFYIDNRPGGGTIIGMEAAVHSDPDGYTLYLAPSTITLLPLVKKKLSVSLANFEPISLAAILPYGLVVNPSTKANNVQEFIALAKAEPGKLTYGSPGIGTGPQMAMQLFLNLSGTDLLHIPYKGVANVVTDIIAGRISAMMLNLLTAKPHIEAGKLRALGVTSAKRADSMEKVPTIAEQGLKGYEALQWFAFFAPKGTPKAIVDKIQQQMAKGLKSPKIKQQLALQGAEPGGNTPAEFAAFLKAESDKWAAVAKAAKIEPR